MAKQKVHSANAQMIGYIYQMNYALYMLIQADDDSSICIEKYDDVDMYSGRDQSFKSVQLKHHGNSNVSITNSSKDIWNTFKSWYDAKDDFDDNQVYRIFITTQKVSNNSFMFYLKNDKYRNVDRAIELIYKYAKGKQTKFSNGVSQSGKENQYDRFLELPEVATKEIIESTFVIDSEIYSHEIENEIKKYLRYTCYDIYIDDVYNELVGWWKNKVENDMLISKQRVSNHELKVKIREITEKYKLTTLPVFEMDNAGGDCKIYSDVLNRQLDLIKLPTAARKVVDKNYLKACVHRKKWLDKECIRPDEIKQYDEELYDYWEDQFYLIDSSSAKSEEYYVDCGLKLFEKLNSLSINIRRDFNKKFLTSGSYYIMANELKIGWHPLYKERLGN